MMINEMTDEMLKRRMNAPLGGSEPNGLAMSKLEERIMAQWAVRTPNRAVIAATGVPAWMPSQVAALVGFGPGGHRDRRPAAIFLSALVLLAASLFAWQALQDDDDDLSHPDVLSVVSLEEL